MIPSFIKVPSTPLKLARRLGLGDLRRHKKDGYVSGLSRMIACMIHNNPSNYQIMRVRFLTLSIILLAPEGSGLFMYILLWLIIPPESDEDYKSRQTPKKWFKETGSPKYLDSRNKQYVEKRWKEKSPWSKGVGFEDRKKKYAWWTEVIKK